MRNLYYTPHRCQRNSFLSILRFLKFITSQVFLITGEPKADLGPTLKFNTSQLRGSTLLIGASGVIILRICETLEEFLILSKLYGTKKPIAELKYFG